MDTNKLYETQILITPKFYHIIPSWKSFRSMKLRGLSRNSIRY